MSVFNSFLLNRKKSIKFDSIIKETMENLAHQKSEIKSIEFTVKDQKNMIAEYVSQVQIIIKTILDKFSRGRFLF